jgi:hypothetical protein
MHRFVRHQTSRKLTKVVVFLLFCMHAVKVVDPSAQSARSAHRMHNFIRAALHAARGNGSNLIDNNSPAAKRKREDAGRPAAHAEREARCKKCPQRTRHLYIAAIHISIYKILHTHGEKERCETVTLSARMMQRFLLFAPV